MAKGTGKAESTSKPKPMGKKLKPKTGKQSNTNTLKAAMAKLAGEQKSKNE